MADNNTQIVEKRKRGRPKKDSTIIKQIKSEKVDKKKINNLKENEKMMREIMITIPITSRDIRRYTQYAMKQLNFICCDENTTEYLNMLSETLSDTCDFTETSDTTTLTEKSIFMPTSREKIKSSTTKEINQEIVKMRKEIARLNNIIDNLVTIDDVEIDTKITFIDATSGKKTDLLNKGYACWNCTENFDSKYYFPIVDNYIDGTWHVFGHFCSDSCADRFNNELKDYRVNERRTLMKTFKVKIFKDSSSITMADPRLVLTKFGGDTELEVYRNKNNIKMYTCEIELPPMETIKIPINRRKNKNKLTESMKENNDNGLVLCRTKPLPKKQKNILDY